MTAVKKEPSMWRTAEALQALPAPAEISGRSDLMEYFQLSQVAPVAAKSLHVDYSNPDHVRQFDILSKLRGPPQSKQLYRQPVPECRWDLLPITRWPPHAYNFHAYPLDSIQRALQLQPGACSIPEAELGEAVGPDRMQLALGSPPAAPPGKAVPAQAAAAAGQAAAAADVALGRGKRTLNKRRRAGLAGESLPSASVASGETGDTTVHDVSSNKAGVPSAVDLRLDAKWQAAIAAAKMPRLLRCCC